MKFTVLFFFCLLLYLPLMAAEKYWLSFTDKKEVCFSPADYFSERTIRQRLQQGISLSDSSDFPINSSYRDAVYALADSVTGESRWLNGMAVFASGQQIDAIRKLPFIKEIHKMIARVELAGEEVLASTVEFSFLNTGARTLLKYQTERMQGPLFGQTNIHGKGIRVAVFDTGFPGVNAHPAFEHLRKNKSIIATYDFIRKKEDVSKGHWHGTATLSCIAGMYDTIPMGMATGAEFLLARTEYATREPFAEEEYWLAAAEWADRHGVNIISSSLGYTNPRYFRSDMNGHTSLVSRAATMAALKGILVVNAAGNEAADDWHIIGAPADADSVLAVGGTEPLRDFHIYFSSLGPTYDGRLKPNVCATGRAVVAKENGFTIAEGTSFSAPLVTGFAAAAWQTNRSVSNMELFRLLESSSHLYPYFDYAHGFGIPQASFFTDTNRLNREPTFDFVIINNEFKVVLREAYSYVADEYAMGYKPVRNLYFKIENSKGEMLSYSVLLAEQKEVLHKFTDDFNPGDRITIHFEGYTQSLVPR